MEVSLICLFFLNPKYYQNEIWVNTSVLYDKYFKHVLAEYWRLEASLNIPYSPFQKNETLES